MKSLSFRPVLKVLVLNTTPNAKIFEADILTGVSSMKKLVGFRENFETFSYFSRVSKDRSDWI